MKLQTENTKALLASLENPLLSSLETPNINNTICNYIWFLQGEYDLEFDFDVFLPSIGENLQRDFVWSLEQQRGFIKSIFLRSYIPNIVVNVLPKQSNFANQKIVPKIFKVIDGKQRLTTIKKFMNNEFEINGFYHRDVEQGFRSFVDLLKFETYYEPLSDSVLVALFEKVNFFGTPQDYERFERIKNKVTAWQKN